MGTHPVDMLGRGGWNWADPADWSLDAVPGQGNTVLLPQSNFGFVGIHTDFDVYALNVAPKAVYGAYGARDIVDGWMAVAGNFTLLEGALHVKGRLTINGRALASAGTTLTAGAVDGTGSLGVDGVAIFGAVSGVSLALGTSPAQATIRGAVDASATIDFGTETTLTLDHAQDFQGKIENFGFLDLLELPQFAADSTVFAYKENAARSGGVLTLADGALKASLNFVGHYTLSEFALVKTAAGGLDITIP